MYSGLTRSPGPVGRNPTESSSTRIIFSHWGFVNQGNNPCTRFVLSNVSLGDIGSGPGDEQTDAVLKVVRLRDLRIPYKLFLALCVLGKTWIPLKKGNTEGADPKNVDEGVRPVSHSLT